MTGSSFLGSDGPVAIAHRGGALAYPENSMAAFQHAVDLGFGWVETDVHVTSDGVLVAFHDDRLDRVTDSTGVVAEMTWAQVGQAKIAGSHPVVRFDELLSTFPALHIAVDPKDDASVRPLVAAIQQGGAIARVCIGSFSDDRIRLARQLLGPTVCVGLGPKATAKLVAASVGTPVGPIAGDVAQVPPAHKGVRLVTSRFVAEAHRRELAVHVWTVNDPIEMNRLLDLGVDGLMTDQPSTLKAVMQERHVWPSQ